MTCSTLVINSVSIPRIPIDLSQKWVLVTLLSFLPVSHYLTFPDRYSFRDRSINWSTHLNKYVPLIIMNSLSNIFFWNLYAFHQHHMLILENIPIICRAGCSFPLQICYSLSSTSHENMSWKLFIGIFLSPTLYNTTRSVLVDHLNSVRQIVRV